MTVKATRSLSSFGVSPVDDDKRCVVHSIRFGMRYGNIYALQ